MKPYYSEAGIEIYHGDCAEVTPALRRRFDLLCTDPPYWIKAPRKQVARRAAPTLTGKGLKQGFRPPLKRYDAGSSWDDRPPPRPLLDALRAMCTHQCIFGGNFFELPPASCWLVWDKENGESDFADCEMAWTNYGTAARLKRYRWNGMLQADMSNREPRLHQTQKPLAVMSWAISKCPERPTTVLDAFLGSGTTLRACKDLGIRAVGIEAEERYCEIAARRLGQGVLALGQEPVHG